MTTNTQQSNTPGVDFILAKMDASHKIVMAKLATMTEDEMSRERILTRAWLDATSAEYYETETYAGGSNRAGRMMDRAGDSGQTMLELTNGVMPDGTQI